MNVPDRRTRARQDRRIDLEKLWADPDYLAFKEKLREPLSPRERAILEAARPAAPPEPAVKPMGDTEP